MNNDLPTAENLMAMGMAGPRNHCKFILTRIIYLLSNPQKWIQWIKTIFLDLKFSRSYLGGRINNESFADDRTGSLSSGYRDLTTIFSSISIKENDIIVDVGCGKGRVLNFLLSKNYVVPLIGVEIDSSVALVTKKKFQRYKNIQIYSGAIEDGGLLETKGAVYYLFNPFFESVMKKFATQLEKNVIDGYYKTMERPIILYYYCYHLHVFEDNPFWKVHKLDGVFAAIISPTGMPSC